MKNANRKWSGASAYEQRIDAEIFSGHGMISLGLYRTIGAACPTIADGYTAQPSADCLELYTAMNAQTGSFDVYNVYDQCPDTGVSASAGAVRDGRTRALEGLLSEGWSSDSMADSLHPTPPLNAPPQSRPPPNAPSARASLVGPLTRGRLAQRGGVRGGA